MELSRTTSDATISLEELRVAAQIALLRLPTQEAVTQRVTLMRALVAAEAALNRAFSAHARCFLVNCQGSHGTGNLAYETEQLHAALMQYLERVQESVRLHQHMRDSAATDVRKGAATRETRVASGTPKVTLRRAV